MTHRIMSGCSTSELHLAPQCSQKHKSKWGCGCHTLKIIHRFQLLINSINIFISSQNEAEYITSPFTGLNVFDSYDNKHILVTNFVFEIFRC